jgi:hypothetical protein
MGIPSYRPKIDSQRLNSAEQFFAQKTKRPAIKPGVYRSDEFGY